MVIKTVDYWKHSLTKSYICTTVVFKVIYKYVFIFIKPCDVGKESFLSHFVGKSNWGPQNKVLLKMTQLVHCKFRTVILSFRKLIFFFCWKWIKRLDIQIEHVIEHATTCKANNTRTLFVRLWMWRKQFKYKRRNVKKKKSLDYFPSLVKNTNWLLLL